MNNQVINQFGQGNQTVVMENYYIIDSYYQSFSDIPQAKIVEVFNFLRTPFEFNELKADHKGNYSVIPTYCRQRLYKAFLPVNIQEEYSEYKLNGGSMYCTCTITVCGVQFTGVGGAKLNVKTAEGVTYDHNTLKSIQSSAFKDACKRLGMPTSSEDMALVIKGVRGKQQAYKPNNQPVRKEQYNNNNNSRQEPNFEQMNNQDPFNNPNFEQMNGQQNIVQMPNQNNQNHSIPCSGCGYEITSQNVIQKSTKIHGKPLCWNCQKKKQAN
ncbi:hypothetical protein MHB40_20585 [Lysinibacillus sp. FSL K6-0057]|uniref:hypothetical protein n=1 Tax=Lysinibacillus sp. FSL K6-0057 TaxID=2921411 RepID=UPI00315AA468